MGLDNCFTIPESSSLFRSDGLPFNNGHGKDFSPVLLKNEYKLRMYNLQKI
jgi:hypothetical protein